MAKLFASRVAWEAADTCVQIRGGADFWSRLLVRTGCFGANRHRPEDSDSGSRHHGSVRLFRRIRQRVGDGPPSPDQAVLVHIAGPMHYGVGLDDIEDALIDAIERAGVGEFDGNELGPEDARLFMYGPDADHLFAVIEPVLWRAGLPPGSYATVRYGEPGAEERRIDLR